MIRFAGLALLLFQDPLTTANLEASLKEVAPLIEKQTGRKFTKLPVVAFSTQEEVAAVVAKEFLPQMKILAPALDPEAGAKQVGEGVAAGLLAKYEAATHMIHVIPETFAKNPKWRAAEFVRMLLVREAVHALDEQSYGLGERVAKATTREELEVLTALVEGHAQFVAAALSSAPESFADLEGYVNEKHPGAADGRRYFEHLARVGKTDAFSRPPKSRAEMLHPRSDLKPIFDDLEKIRARKAWRINRSPLDERAFRTGCGTFLDKAVVDDAAKGLLGGDVLVASAEDGSAISLVAIHETDSDASAKKLYDAQVALCKAKDQKMTEGTIRIIAAEYTSQASEKAAAMVLVEKTLKTAGGDVKVNVGLARVDRFTIEVTYSNEPVEKAKIVELVEKMCEKLKALK